MRKVAFFLFSIIGISIHAQDLPRVKEDLARLASKEFAGRGYVKSGLSLASEYIQKRLDGIGVEPYGDTYAQTYGFEVNTFPRISTLKIDGRPLEEGYDFIINPGSGDFRGKVHLVHIDSALLLDGDVPDLGKRDVPVLHLDGLESPEEAAIVYDFTQRALKERAVIQIKEKLTWSVGRKTYDYPLLEVGEGTLERSAERARISVDSENLDFTAENLIGKIAGTRSDSLVVFSAHYDHLGMMGNALFAGASDNATGTAMLLDLAAHFASEKPEFDTYFIFFSGEEAGLIGSKYFVDHPVFELNRVKLLINLDLMGSAAKGITVVNGRLYQDKMAKMASINSQLDLVPKIRLRGKAANSDHYWFSERGVPAIFIYTEGNISAYHDVYDLPESVDWANYEEVFTLLVEFIETL